MEDRTGHCFAENCPSIGVGSCDLLLYVVKKLTYIYVSVVFYTFPTLGLSSSMKGEFLKGNTHLAKYYEKK